MSVVLPESIDVGGLVRDIEDAVKDSFLTQDATFRYAMHLTPETLQALGSGQASKFREGLSSMQAALQAKLPAVLAQLMEPESLDPTPLSAEDQAKCDRMEAFFGEVNPDLLAKLDMPMPGSDGKPDMNGFLKREMLLVMDAALADSDLEALYAFHRSPAGKEIKAKEALLAPDQEGGLLQLLAHRACEPYLAVIRAEQEAQAARLRQEMEQLMAQIRQQLGVDVPPPGAE